MTPKHDTSGPAFPNVTTNGSDSDAGMSIRDYFAASAMQGICAHTDTWGRDISEIVATAYVLADAMLRAREAAPTENRDAAGAPT